MPSTSIQPGRIERSIKLQRFMGCRSEKTCYSCSEFECSAVGTIRWHTPVHMRPSIYCAQLVRLRFEQDQRSVPGTIDSPDPPDRCPLVALSPFCDGVTLHPQIARSIPHPLRHQLRETLSTAPKIWRQGDQQGCCRRRWCCHQSDRSSDLSNV